LLPHRTNLTNKLFWLDLSQGFEMPFAALDIPLVNAKAIIFAKI